MTRLLDKRVVLITGGGGGIGREVALAAANVGACVCVNDLGTSVSGDGASPTASLAVAEEIRSAGGEAIADAGSVANWADATRMVERVVATYGRIDAVVNNAAIIDIAPFDETDPERFASVLSVNLTGAFLVARAAAPHFREQRAGVFLHMTSSAGLIGAKGMAAYAAAKAGVVQLSKVIALDMARHGIRSNCLAPSSTSRASEAAEALRGLSLEPVDTTMIPQAERKGTPSHIVPAALFLLSDLSAAVNGQVIGARKNELYLYNQSRPVRIIQREAGWEPETIAAQVLPAWRDAFMRADEDTHTVFSWRPC